MSVILVHVFWICCRGSWGIFLVRFLLRFLGYVFLPHEFSLELLEICFLFMVFGYLIWFVFWLFDLVCVFLGCGSWGTIQGFLVVFVWVTILVNWFLVAFVWGKYFGLLVLVVDLGVGEYPYPMMHPTWGGGLNACPDGLGHLYTATMVILRIFSK